MPAGPAVARTKGSSNQFLRSAFGPSAVAPHASIAQSANAVSAASAARRGRGRSRDRQGSAYSSASALHRCSIVCRRTIGCAGQVNRSIPAQGRTVADPQQSYMNRELRLH
jgi:hypothetical protein